MSTYKVNIQYYMGNRQGKKLAKILLTGKYIKKYYCVKL
jgi:hypothetical protein